jgi:hypothetical protein
LEPNRKLHPEIFAIKTLMGDLVAGRYKSNWGSA